MTLETFSASRRAPLYAGLILCLAGLLAYANSLRGPFVFDDKPAIVENLTIRHLGSSLSPPPGAFPVSGRPVMNLSLALNYGLSGLSTWSYHGANLLIHLLAGLTLFGIVRRTLVLVGTGGSPVRFSRGFQNSPDGRAARPTLFAFAVALLWLVHPLQTESVTYLSQRAESLMGLFYLLTLYCSIRQAEAPAPLATASLPTETISAPPPDEAPTRASAHLLWAAGAVLACCLGMLTKEVMVSAPLLVLLYDRTFLSGSFAQAWQRRRGFYLSLAGAWIFLAWSVVSAGTTRGDTSGFAVAAPWWAYWLTQFEAVGRYLWLSVWPRPLVIYYEAFWVKNAGQVLPGALVVLPLVAGTLWALWRRPVAGFLGVWFFAMLAPTSLVPNTIQMIAEHRMYLPLAAVIVAAVAGIFSALEGKRGLAACLALAAVFLIVTVRRNQIYQSDQTLWADTVAERPANPFAHNNLGEALAERGAFPEAVEQYQESLRLDPTSVYAWMNLAGILERTGHLPEAIGDYRQAVRLKPDWASVHDNLADALGHAGQLPAAIAEYQRALELKPDYAQAENGLGAVLFRTGNAPQAIAHFQTALQLRPDYAEASNNLGTALASVNRLPEAVASYERAVALQPNYAQAHLNLGNAYYQANRLPEALQEYATALQLQPGSAETYDHYGILLAESGRLPEAEEQFKQGLQLKPGDRELQGNLQRVQDYERAHGGAPAGTGGPPVPPSP